MEQKINWYRTPVDRGLLKELTVRSDIRGLLQAGGFLLIYAATVYFSYFFFARRMWFATVAACYVHCMFHGFVGMEAAVHELSHWTPFKRKWLGDLFYYLFSFLTWNNAVHFRVSHSKHHQLTLHTGRDKEVVLEPIDLNWLDFLSWFTFDVKKFKMYMFPNVANAVGNGDADPFSWDPLFQKGDKKRKRMIGWAQLMLIGHLILLGLFIYYQLWVLIIVVTFGYFFATFPSKGCVIQQHLGLRSNIPDWRVICHTMIFGPLMGFLYWNMNYHIEHHMFAAVPFYNLKKLHKAIVHDTPEPVKGYLRGIRKIMAIRKEQRRDPDYYFMPRFPSTAAPAKVTS